MDEWLDPIYEEPWFQRNQDSLQLRREVHEGLEAAAGPSISITTEGRTHKKLTFVLRATEAALK